MSKDYVSVYGNQSLAKVYCPDCQRYAFLVDGIKQCCETEQEFNGTRYKIESSVQEKRRSLYKKRFLEKSIEQNGKCYYCEYPFSQAFIRKNKIIILRIEVDHFIPYSYNCNNKALNFVLACHICNGIKSNKFFNTKEEAQEYIWARRNEKKYEPI